MIQTLLLLTLLASAPAREPSALRLPCAANAGPGAAEGTRQARSYCRLRGRRLRRFEASGGASEGGNPVEIELPADRLAPPRLGPLGASRRWATFLHGGVRYHLRRDHPHFIQTLRKLDKRGMKGARLRWRGRVKHLRLDGKRVLSVRLDELRLQPRTGTRRRRARNDGQHRPERDDDLAAPTPGRGARARGTLPADPPAGERRTG